MTALKEFIEESRKYTVLLYKKDIIGYDFLCKSFLEIEKQQIIDAWHNGFDNQSPMIDEGNCGQTYYKQTYNQPNQ